MQTPQFQFQVIEVANGRVQVISTHRKSKVAMAKVERLTVAASEAMFVVHPVAVAA